jgi:hypothetical protein
VVAKGDKTMWDTLEKYMAQVFGVYQGDLLKTNEYLIIRFSPSSVPLKERWRNNGISADFMADYTATFFPADNSDVRSAVSFIANELIENAMKFHDYTSDQAITVGLFLHQDRLVFHATNVLDHQGVNDYQAIIEELLNSDPTELYLQQLEANATAADNEEARSGIGFLTMLNDYQVKLGWSFEPDPHESEKIAVKTLVDLTVESL